MLAPHGRYAALAALEGLDPPGTALSYRGKVLSGATIGVWKHTAFEHSPVESTPTIAGGPGGPRAPGAPNVAEVAAAPSAASPPSPHASPHASLSVFEVALEYRDDLGTVASCDAEAERWRATPEHADSNAMIERCRRKRMRLDALPVGPAAFPYRVCMQRIGSAVLIAFEGELCARHVTRPGPLRLT